MNERRKPQVWIQVPSCREKNNSGQYYHECMKLYYIQITLSVSFYNRMGGMIIVK